MQLLADEPDSWKTQLCSLEIGAQPGSRGGGVALRATVSSPGRRVRRAA